MAGHVIYVCGENHRQCNVTRCPIQRRKDLVKSTKFLVHLNILPIGVRALETTVLHYFIQFTHHTSHPMFVDPTNNFFSIYGKFELLEK